MKRARFICVFTFELQPNSRMNGLFPCRPVTPVPAPGYAWFDFDDSRVRPVSESYIEKHFSGKECAYMLFYRKRSMARPDEGERPLEGHLLQNQRD